MINLYRSELLDIVPESMKSEPEIKALSFALQKTNQQLIDWACQCGIYADIENLPEKVLDLLALEFHVPYWEETLSLIKKKQLVKSSMQWNNILGSRKSVEWFLQMLLESNELEEWMQTGEKPGTFQIRTQDVIAQEKYHLLFRFLKDVKNIRSHLRMIIVEKVINGSFYTGAYSKSKHKEFVTDIFKISQNVNGKIYYSLFPMSKTTIKIR